MSTRHAYLWAYVGIVSAIVAMGHAEDVPFSMVGRTSSPPVIDGDISDGCWGRANALGPFVGKSDGQHATPQTTGYLSYDNDCLYAALACREPQMKEVLTKQHEHDGPVWTDNCVEVFIRPAGSKVYYHLAVNAEGTTMDWLVTDAALRGNVVKYDKTWDVRTAPKVGLNEDAWAIEMAIPFGSLGTKPKEGDVWAVNLCRTRRIGKDTVAYSCWSATGGGYHVPKRFGRVQFGDPGVTVRELLFSPARFGENRGKAVVLKQGPANETVTVKTSIDRNEKSDTYTVSKEVQELPVGYRVSSAGGSEVGIRILTKQGLLLSHYSAVPNVDPVKVETQKAYYHLDRVPLTIKACSNVGTTDQGYALVLSLLRHNGEAAKRETIKPVPPVTEKAWDIGTLPEGKYYVRAELTEGEHVVFSTDTVFRRIKRSPPREKVDVKTVTIDENLNLCLNGKPFFPLYGYHVKTDEKSMAEYAELSFNMADRSSTTMKKYNILGWYANYSSWVTSGIEEEKIREAAASLKSRDLHPLWYSLGDEIEQSDGMSVDEYSKISEYMRGIAGDRPISHNFCNPGVWHKYAEYTDIFSFDMYPIPHMPVSSVAQFTDAARRAVKDKKPVFYVVQNYAHAGKRYPTPAEQRCMAYLAIVHGAKGLGFYSMYEANGWYAPRDIPLLWSNLRGVLTEIVRVAPAIAKPTCFTEAKICDNPAVHTMVKEVSAKEYYVFAVNSSDKEQAVAFELPFGGIRSIEEVFIHYGHSSGSFEERFDPFEARVYRVELP